METSPFRRLSPELRNRVYELVFTASDGYFAPGYLELRLISKYNVLTRICRQIRHETHAMFYASYAFIYQAYEHSAKDVSALLQLLGPNVVSQFRSLRIALPSWFRGVHERDWRVTIIGQGWRLNEQLPSSSQTPEALNDIPRELHSIRDSLSDKLADMGLIIEGRDCDRSRGGWVCEDWIVSKKPGLDGSEVSSEQE